MKSVDLFLFGLIPVGVTCGALLGASGINPNKNKS